MINRTQRSRRKRQMSLISNIIFCLITLTALTGCIILLLQNYGLKNESRQAMARIEAFEEREEEYIYTQEDLEAYSARLAETEGEARKQQLLDDLKQRMSTGETTAQMLRDFFPEDVVVYSDGAYQFFPISDRLKKHDYVYDNFLEKEGGEVVYTDEAGEEKSLKGIDVSKHQGKIDWKKVAGDGVDYAFIRAGYRGSAEGKLVEDEWFQTNIKGALNNGIEVGIYFYTQAVSEEEAIEEAEFVLELIKGYDVTFPVVFDIEETGNEKARTAGMTREENTKAAIAFLDTIREEGYTPMIYGNLKSYLIMLDMEQLEDYEKWFAYYNVPVYFPYEFSIWQYTSQGSINGISGDVDLNVCMKEYAP